MPRKTKAQIEAERLAQQEKTASLETSEEMPQETPAENAGLEDASSPEPEMAPPVDPLEKQELLLPGGMTAEEESAPLYSVVPQPETLPVKTEPLAETSAGKTPPEEPAPVPTPARPKRQTATARVETETERLQA